MKTFQRIMACILVLSMMFAFASCKNDDTKPEQNSNTISTTEKEVEANKENTTASTTVADTDVNLVGMWTYDETVTPQTFYADFFDPEITQTSIELRTTYEFNSNGTFSIDVSIMNITAVRVEYRALMVAVGRANIESQGEILTPDDVLYYENYADTVLKEICTAQEGKYVVDGNKIVYTTNEDSFYETFTLSGNNLTLKDSSTSNEGYPITMIRETKT